MLKALFPWKHNKTKVMAAEQTMYDNGGPASTTTTPPTIDQPILIEKQNLSPCHVCGRTFLPASLRKHEKICEKNATKKRKVFDSLKQRVEGTDLAAFHQKSYLKRQTIEPVQVECNRIKRQSQWKEKHLELVNAIRAAKGQNTTQMSTPVRKTAPVMAPNERCPSCDRQFGPKAYDRHVEWCKERKARIHHSPANVLLAKERLEARIRYRVPPIKTKRQANKEKYSGGTSPTEMSTSLTSTSKVGSFSRGPSIRRPKPVAESGTSTSTSSSSHNKYPEKKEKSPVRVVPKSPVLERVQSKTNIHTKRCSLPSLKLNKSDINEVFGIFTVSSISYPNCSSTRSTKSINSYSEPKKLVTWKDTIPKNTSRKIDTVNVKLPQIPAAKVETKTVAPVKREQTFSKGTNTLNKFKNSFQNKEVLNSENSSNELLKSSRKCENINEEVNESVLAETDSESFLDTRKIRLNSPGVNLMYRSAVHLVTSESSIQSSDKTSDTEKHEPEVAVKDSCESLTQAFENLHLDTTPSTHNFNEIMTVASRYTADSLDLEGASDQINVQNKKEMCLREEELFSDADETTTCTIDDKNLSEWFDKYCLDNTPDVEELFEIHVKAPTSNNNLISESQEKLKKVVMLFQKKYCRQSSSQETVIIDETDVLDTDEKVKITEIVSDDELLPCSLSEQSEDKPMNSTQNSGLSLKEISSNNDLQYESSNQQSSFDNANLCKSSSGNCKNSNEEFEITVLKRTTNCELVTSTEEVNSVETYSLKLSELELSSWSRSNCGECYERNETQYFRKLKRSSSEIYNVYNWQTSGELVRSNSESNICNKYFSSDKFASRPNMDLTKFTLKHSPKEDSYQSHQQLLQIAASEFINDCRNRDVSSGRNYLLDEDYTVPKKRMKLATESNDEEQQVDVNKIVVVPGINDSQKEMLTLNATSSSTTSKSTSRNFNHMYRSSSANILSECYSPRLLILLRKMINNFQTMAKCNDNDKVLELTKNECQKLIELDTKKLPKLIDHVKGNRNVCSNKIHLPKIIDRHDNTRRSQNNKNNNFSPRNQTTYFHFGNVLERKTNSPSQNVTSDNAGRGDYDKKKSFKKQNSLFDVAPKKPPSLKSKAEVENYFNSDKSTKSNNRNRKSPDLEEKEMETILKPEDLFAVDDEMYEEYKKYEEMYLREKQQKAKSKKQKPKLIDVNYGLLTASEEDDMAQLNKLSNDSAYGSLTRKTPKRNRNTKLSPLEQKNPDSTSSSGSEHNPTANTAKQDLSSFQEQQRLSKFCHECGQKYPLNSAKFCVECGVRRLVL